MNEPQKNDANTVTHYMQLRERIETLGLVLDIRQSDFVLIIGNIEYRFVSLFSLDCFVQGLEARG